MELILGIIIGLIVGWNFIPQPTIVRDIVASAVAKIKSLFNK